MLKVTGHLYAAAADLTREDLKHFSVGGALVALDGTVRELEEQARQTLRRVLLIGRLGNLPAHVTVWQTNQHHLHTHTDQSGWVTHHRLTNQHHLHTHTDQSGRATHHRPTNQHHLHMADQPVSSVMIQSTNRHHPQAAGTRKFDRSPGQILHIQLHWLDIPDRVLFVLAVTFTSVWTAAHHRICRSTASRSPVLTRGGICVPPTVIYLL